MRARSLVALLGFVGFVSVPVHAVAAEPSRVPLLVRPRAFAPVLPRGAKRVGAIASEQPITFDVVLPPANRAELDSLLHELYDPASPRFRHWLAPGEFARRFGPNPVLVASVVDWLHRAGLADTRLVDGNVEVHATAGLASRALGVSFSRFRAGGADSFSADQAPLVPDNIAGEITAVAGLSNTVRLAPRLHRIASLRAGGPHAVTRDQSCSSAVAQQANAANGWTVAQSAARYQMSALHDAGLQGSGRTVALFELAPHKAADVSAYLDCFSLHNPVSARKVLGGGTSDASGTLEANLDIEDAASTAPGSKVVSYEGPNTELGGLKVWSAIVNDDKAQVVSSSWGVCESQQTAGERSALHPLFQQAAAQGQTIFAATGDSGSEDCYLSLSDTTLTADSPANDPLITAVGGTSLVPHQGLTDPDHEPVWNDCQHAHDINCANNSNNGAAGGGLSHAYAKPSWQPVAAASTCGAGCRELPDISANAGVGEAFNSGGWQLIGGTSIAAPKLAGLATDIASGCVDRLGSFGARLYGFAQNGGYGRALRDVPAGEGDNDLTRSQGGRYPTAAGFDLATGLGTPLAAGLSCPAVRTVKPLTAKAGAAVLLEGIGLAHATVHFGHTIAHVVSESPTSAKVVVPGGSGRADIWASSALGRGTTRVTFLYPDAARAVVASYRIVAADGRVASFGGAQDYGGPPAGSLPAPIVGMAVDKATGGYWLAGADGSVHAFHAPFFGDAVGYGLRQPVVGIAASPDGGGYRLVARDGGIFTFGNAKYYGSTGGMHLNRPIVGMAADPNTGGYWLVASDGGVFAFNAPFYGSTGSMQLARPIVGLSPTGDARGYWFVASDGGVFSFGDARFSGSGVGRALTPPIVAIGA